MAQPMNPRPTNRSHNWLRIALSIAAIAAICVGIWYVFVRDDNSSASTTIPSTDVSTPATFTTTPQAPTPTTVSTTVEIGTALLPNGEWIAFESEGGIPFNGTNVAFDVAPDEIEVFTAGPVSVNGIMLSGGATRGSIVIFLPDPTMVVHYEATNVIAGSNWHGSYRPQTDPTAQSTWSSLVNFTVNNMRLAPNCSYGTGCTTIDVLIISPSGVVDQFTLTS